MGQFPLSLLPIPAVRPSWMSSPRMLVAVIPTSSHSSCSEQKLLLFLFCKWICNMKLVLSKDCHELQTITQLMTEMFKMEPKKLHFVRTSLLERVAPHTQSGVLRSKGWGMQIQDPTSYYQLPTTRKNKTKSQTMEVWIKEIFTELTQKVHRFMRG